MNEGLGVVLDVGKTLTKLSLWSSLGEMLARETRPNRRLDAGAYAALDADGIEAWAATVLRDFAARGPVGAIIPVAHGAALAVVRGGRLACPPLDYEAPIPPAVRAAYEPSRDAFALTGSPLLPDGLNAGVQLEWLERLHAGLLVGDAAILTWPQYWAWRFCGVASTEVTSLGCHTDLWRPYEARPSELAAERGWAARLAPLRTAGEVLGPVTAAWVERTGLPADTQVYCGLHDSNAALLAARAFPEIAGRESTVLSTGTWFVGMRSPAAKSEVDMSLLPEARDCLVNVDALGMPVPSARFMGGREIELLSGGDATRIDIKRDQAALLAATPAVVASGGMALPTFAAGFGPFSEGHGRWLDAPLDPFGRRAAVCLYAALVADTSLRLISSRERVLVEGRFAEVEVFVRSLAALRPDLEVYVSDALHDASYGALRLVDPSLRSLSGLRRAATLEVDLGDYARSWRRRAAGIEAAT